MNKLQLSGQKLAEVPTLGVAECVCRRSTCMTTKQSSLELKIRAKQLLVFLLLASAIPGQTL
jgi:hypothetical protein